MRTNRTHGTLGNNLKMSDSTYAKRREVMNYVYEAKNLLRSHGIDMPRIDVRITDNSGHPHALGMARLKDNIVWVNENGLECRDLRHVVFHEIVHAVTGFGHSDFCPLMAPHLPKEPLPKELIDMAFVSYFKR